MNIIAGDLVKLTDNYNNLRIGAAGCVLSGAEFHYVLVQRKGTYCKTTSYWIPRSILKVVRRKHNGTVQGR